MESIESPIFPVTCTYLVGYKSVDMVREVHRVENFAQN